MTPVSLAFEPTIRSQIKQANYTTSKEVAQRTTSMSIHRSPYNFAVVALSVVAFITSFFSFPLAFQASFF